MKNKWINAAHVEGWLFSHTLDARVAGDNAKNPGQEYIRGNVSIAVDEEATNVVQVNFMYVTPTFKSGKPNDTYKLLEEIVNGDYKTFEQVGTDAVKLRIDGQVEVNDFFPRGEDEVASPKRISGSFAHVCTSGFTPSATFDFDMLISKCVEREIEDGDDYVNLEGYMFNFRNQAFPITVTVNNPAGMQYYMNQDISSKNPLLTEVWGNIESKVIERERESAESAWGEAKATTSTTTIRSWAVSGSSVEPMPWDDDETLTVAEFKKMLADREEYLAGIKQRAEEYAKSQTGKAGFPAVETKKAASDDSAPWDDDDDDFDF